MLGAALAAGLASAFSTYGFTGDWKATGKAFVIGFVVGLVTSALGSWCQGLKLGFMATVILQTIVVGAANTIMYGLASYYLTDNDYGSLWDAMADVAAVCFITAFISAVAQTAARDFPASSQSSKALTFSDYLKFSTAVQNPLGSAIALCVSTFVDLIFSSSSLDSTFDRWGLKEYVQSDSGWGYQMTTLGSLVQAGVTALVTAYFTDRYVPGARDPRLSWGQYMFASVAGGVAGEAGKLEAMEYLAARGVDGTLALSLGSGISSAIANAFTQVVIAIKTGVREVQRVMRVWEHRADATLQTANGPKKLTFKEAVFRRQESATMR